MSAESPTLQQRYRLDRLLGTGGFARVYLATDLQLNRRVAVKVLNPDLLLATPDRDFRRRFKEEAQTVAALDHPNILGIFDYGEAAGTLFLVMPYVEGGTLDLRLRAAGRFTPQQAATYLQQAAAALDHAHRRSLVHRDIKPQNMLLRAEDDRLLLADFGIAKLIRETSAAQSRSAIVGTIAYMAPEQFQGRTTAATDLYALGCLLFQLLAGSVPYSGATEQVMYGHMLGPVPSLIERSGGQATPAIQAVVERALAKDPARRFGSAGELARAFAAAVTSPAMPGGAAIPPRAEHPTLPLDPPPAQPGPVPVPNEPPAAGHPPSRPHTGKSRRALAWWAAGLAVFVVAVVVGGYLALGALPLGTRTPTVAPTTVAQASPSPTGAAGGQPTTPAGTLPPRTAITLPGHTNRVEAAAWSPNGEYLATASEDGTARLWRPNGQLVRVLTGHTDAVRCLGWSPDGKYLATGGKDGDVLIWEAQIDQPRRVPGVGDTVSALAWSPDGRFLVTASDRVRFLQVGTWASATAAEPGEGTRVLSWSPDGRLLAVGANKGSLRLFAGDGGLVARLTGHTDDVTSIAWSPDSSRFASAGGNLQLWDVPHRRPVMALDGHSGAVTTVAWSPDGRLVASGSADKTIRLWHQDGTSTVLHGHDKEVRQVAWLHDGTLVSGDNDSQIRWWSPAGVPVGEGKGAGCGVWHIAPAPGEALIAVAQGCSATEIWR